MIVEHTDIKSGVWFDAVLPHWAVPYTRLARLDRPIGWWLLLLPCWWGLALAAPRHPDPVLFLLFWLGAVVMRGAGCTLNDIVDRDIDAQVERTRRRPLPSGQVSVRAAVAFMALQSAIGAIVLFSLNWASIALGFAVLAIVATYPFMKRLTFWPQFFLGLNFNWGALMGWVAVTGRLDLAPVLLYAGGIAWTLGYDTIYAHQDARDDVAAGVKSTALRFGAATKIWVAGFYAGTTILVGAALALTHPSPWAILLLAAAGLHFAWQVTFWHPADPADCLRRFRSNRLAGGLIALACLATGWG